MNKTSEHLRKFNNKFYKNLKPEVIGIWSECNENVEDFAKHFSSLYSVALCFAILNEFPNPSYIRAIDEVTYDCLGKPSCLANEVRIRYFLAKSLDQISSE